jgi:WD40 repeat protein
VRIWDPRRDPRGWVLHWKQAKNDILYDPPPAGLNVQTMKQGIKFQAWLEADGRPLVSTTLVQEGASGSWIQQSALLKGGRVAVVSKTDARTLTILATDGRMRLLPAKAGPIQAVAADSAGNWLAWAAPTKDGVIIRSWNATAEAEGESIHLKAPAVRSLSIAPKGDWVLAVASEVDAKAGAVLWSIDCTGKQPPSELLRAPQFGGAAFRADGRELAVSAGNTVKIFSAGRWELGQTSGLADAVALAYSPNGRRLAAINDEGVVTLIDPASGKSLFQLHSMCPLRPKHLPHQPSIAFSPDGAWLVSANWDRTFNLWDGSFDELPAPARIKN